MKRLVLLLLGILLAGCPSAYQTARLLAPGKTRVAAAVTHVRLTDPPDHYFDYDATPGDSTEAIELMVDRGLAERVEIGLRFSNFTIDHYGRNVAWLGAKVGLVRDRLALQLPVGAAWTAGSDRSLLAHPRLIGSVPLGCNAELVGAAGVLLVVPDGYDNSHYFGASVGARLSTNLEVWAFQPEIDVMKLDDEILLAAGAALSLTL